MTTGNDLDREGCEKACAQVNEYLDRALEDVDLDTVERHLELCTRCAHQFGFEQRLRETIRQHCREHQAPPQLRQKIAALVASL